jgi:excisionase family DNA binding protein
MNTIHLAHYAQDEHDAHDAEAARVVGNGEYLTTGEAAEVIGVSKSTVVKLIADGKLPVTRVPGSTHRRIARKVAEDLRDRMRQEAAGMPPPGRHASE